MRELRFDGLSPDGSRLVLAGKDGQKYTVAIDERLEAAVRRDRARIGQVEIEQAGVLRPREIQARIRAGATAEDVAAASGLPIEHIRRFEGPVLTERAWVAEQAQSTEVRRPGGDLELGDLVAERLSGEGVDPADIAWDAWRRDDGLWVVIATFPIGHSTHVATWTYDSVSRTMTIADDNARELSAIDAVEPMRLVPARPALAPVAPLDEDEDEHEPAAIIRPLPRPEPSPDEDEDAGEHGDGPAEGELDDEDAGLADPEQPLDEDAGLAEGELDDEDAGLADPEQPLDEEDQGVFPGDEGLAPADDEGEGGDTSGDEGEEAADHRPTADAEDVPLFDTPAPKPTPRPGARPSVPSFDDILFGPGPGTS